VSLLLDPLLLYLMMISLSSAAAVVIKASDVALLQEELDLTRDAAEGLLRQARGDFAAALSAYIQGGM
jgi:hypothetical protein